MAKKPKAPEASLPLVNWRDPSADIIKILTRRAEALQRIKADKQCLPGLFAFYRDNPIAFITDWGITYDPRNLQKKGMSAYVPFIPWPKQVEWLDWVIALWRASEPGLTEKSRDCGVSWLAISLSCSLSLFNEGMAIGFGSRKESYVDQAGDPKSLFEKGRIFLEYVPACFKLGWNKDNDAPHMRLRFPETQSIISGEAGDNIGRGDRKSIYFVDEEAHLERPDLVEAALSATTDCRISMSSVNGMGNPFAIKRFSGNISVFTFHWRDDPRKDDAWYAKKVKEINNPVIVAQELDIDYTASVTGTIIPAVWVQAAIDSHFKLGIKVSGDVAGALDVADEGSDPNAFVARKGILVNHAELWHGKDSDIFATTQRSFEICDRLGLPGFRYDADGLGAGVRGDARIINERRAKKGQSQLLVDPYRGSAGVNHPEREDVKGRKNKDYFGNRKAQAWWSLRDRFERTYLWVECGQECDPDEIISLSKTMPLLHQLTMELSRPTAEPNTLGKLIVDKTPDGVPSPNLADDVVMLFAGFTRAPMKISVGVLQKASQFRPGGMNSLKHYRPRLG